MIEVTPEYLKDLWYEPEYKIVGELIYGVCRMYTFGKARIASWHPDAPMLIIDQF